MIKFSVNIHRGCFGGCAFCTISAHQGKFIVSRSKESILKEVKEVMQLPDFKGYLSDLGGPSANMYQMKGKDEAICKKCKRPSCIHPKVCPNLNSDHRPLLDIYKAVDAIPGIKKSFIGSGVRYDLLLHQSKDAATNRSTAEYTRELIVNHVSGRLKVAPEHTSDRVLSIMRKPSFEQFETFKKIFDRINREENLRQQHYTVLYLFAPRLQGRRHGGTGCYHQAAGLSSGASTGLYPYSDDCSHRSMVQRISSLYTGTCIQCQNTTGETGTTTILLLV